MNTSTDTTVASVQKIVTTGGILFGAAGVVAPRLLHRAYGTGDLGPDGLHMTQLWGTALAAVGALGMMATPADRQRTLAVAAAMNVANAVSASTAAGLPARARVGSALTSVVFAAVAVYGVLAEE